MLKSSTRVRHTSRRSVVITAALSLLIPGITIPVFSPAAVAAPCPTGWTNVGSISGDFVCQIVLTSDDSAWSPPSGITSVDVVMVGGGGGGSGAGGITPSTVSGYKNYSVSGNGGGGGEVVYEGGWTAFPVAVVVGTGGVLGSGIGAGSAGGDGGRTTFGSAGPNTGANGGKGGVQSPGTQPADGTVTANQGGASGSAELGGDRYAGDESVTASTSQPNLADAGGGGGGAGGPGGSARQETNAGNDPYAQPGDGGAGVTITSGLFAVATFGAGGGGGGGEAQTSNPAVAAQDGGGAQRDGVDGLGGGGAGQSSGDDGSNGIAVLLGGKGGDGAVYVRAIPQSPPAPTPTPNPPAPNPGPNPAPNPGPAPAPAAPADGNDSSNDDESTSDGGSSNVTPAPTSLPAATSSDGAVVLVGGQQVAVTATPLSDATTGAGGEPSPASSLPPRLQRQLPPANGSQLTVGNSTFTVTGPQLGGSREGSSLAIAPGAPVNLALSGLQAGTQVGTYVLNEDGTFVLIGTAVVDADGTISSAVTVPAGAVTGTGRLQIQGTDASGAALAVGLDAQILPPVAPVPRATGALPEVQPGRVAVINAEGEDVRSSIERVKGTDIRIRAQDSTANIQAVDSDGVRPLGTQGAIEVEEEGFVRLNGAGFQPNSTVEVWMFSDPTFVGVVQTDAEGNYGSLLQMPEDLKSGEHTLQSTGTARNGSEVAAATGLRVTEAENAAVVKQQKLNTTVFFDRMSSKLDAADKKKLDRIASKVGNGSSRVTVTGFVQASSDKSNDKSLSSARARAVAKYLRSQGVRGTFTVRGKGVLDGPSNKARSARVQVRTGG